MLSQRLLDDIHTLLLLTAKTALTENTTFSETMLFLYNSDDINYHATNNITKTDEQSQLSRILHKTAQ